MVGDSNTRRPVGPPRPAQRHPRGRRRGRRNYPCGMRLTDRRPEIGAGELIDSLVPPPRFDGARFATYVPNPTEPSQARAVTAGAAFADAVADAASRKPRKRLFGA